MRTIPIAIMLAACSGPEPEPADTDTPAPVWPDPTIRVTEPLADAAVTGDTLRVVVTTTDFELTRKDEVVLLLPTPIGLLTGVAWAHVSGEQPNGYIAYKVDGIALAETIETDVTLSVSALTEGAHTLLVELHYPDGDTFYPPALDQIPFTYAP